MSKFRELTEQAASALSSEPPIEWDRERPDARVLEVLNLAGAALVNAITARTKFAVVDCVDTAMRELASLDDALRGEVTRVSTPNAPESHRYYVEVPRPHREVFELMRTGEGVEAARRRLGPRLRCECGRGFGSLELLREHHVDPLRSERFAAPD